MSFFWHLVQSVGHRPVKAEGLGSSPRVPAILKETKMKKEAAMTAL